MNTNTLKITQKDFDAFVRLLNNFDYYYSYSDDVRVYSAGKDQDDVISLKTKENELFAEIYHEWEVIKTTTKADEKDAAQKKLALIREHYTDNTIVLPVATALHTTAPVVAVGSIVRHFGVPQTDDEYIASRAKEAAQLFSQMKWESAGGSGRVVKCEIYNIVLWRCFMHYNTHDVNISVKAAKADPMAPYIAEFKTEAQMLAWILQKYW